eukprot:6693480-Prymnesium_polylepis.2
MLLMLRPAVRDRTKGSAVKAKRRVQPYVTDWHPVNHDGNGFMLLLDRGAVGCGHASSGGCARTCVRVAPNHPENLAPMGKGLSNH